MAWRRPGDKPLYEPMMVRSLTHICVTRPQWVKWDRCGWNGIFVCSNAVSLLCLQADRSPCGSGTTARIALQFAKGQIGIGQERISQNGLTGSCFTAKVHSQTTCGDFPAVVVEVSGKAHYTGSSVFTLEEDDEQRGGFKVR